MKEVISKEDVPVIRSDIYLDLYPFIAMVILTLIGFISLKIYDYIYKQN